MNINRALRGVYLAEWLTTVCAFVGVVHGTTVFDEFEFEGRITGIVEGETGVFLGFGSIGDRFWGKLSYSSEWHNAHPETQVPYGQYTYRTTSDPPEASIALSFNTDHVNLVNLPWFYLSEVDVLNDDIWLDRIAVYGGAKVGQVGMGMVLSLGDFTSTALSDNRLPRRLELSDWPDEHSFSLYHTSGPHAQLEDVLAGELTMLRTVPDSGNTLALSCLGLTGVLLVRAMLVLGSSSRRRPAECT